MGGQMHILRHFQSQIKCPACSEETFGKITTWILFRCVPCFCFRLGSLECFVVWLSSRHPLQLTHRMIEAIQPPQAVGWKHHMWLSLFRRSSMILYILECLCCIDVSDSVMKTPVRLPGGSSSSSITAGNEKVPALGAIGLSLRETRNPVICGHICLLLFAATKARSGWDHAEISWRCCVLSVQTLSHLEEAKQTSQFVDLTLAGEQTNAGWRSVS